MTPFLFTLVGLYGLAAATGFALAAASAVRAPRVAGARRLSLFLLACAWWALADCVELFLPTPGLRLLLSQLQYFAAAAAAPLCLLMAAEQAGLGRFFAGRLRAPALWAIPSATLVAAWTNSVHRWVWTSIDVPPGGVGLARYNYGPLFWVFVGYSLLCASAAAVLLFVAAAFSLRGFRLRFVAFALGACSLCVGGFAYAFKLGPLPDVDWTALAFLGVGVALSWGARHRGVLDVAPIARDALYSALPDGVLVFDGAGRVADANAAATALLAPGGDSLLGRSAESLVERWPALYGVFAAAAPSDIELCAVLGEDRVLEGRAAPIFSGSLPVGRLVILRDITVRRRAELERERLIEELRRAAEEISTLSGLIPVCASCRRVRDDEGFWSRFETYVAKHTGAQITHGLCPECAARAIKELEARPSE
ncbi:MAG: histidine kinase N-terminal 7TM domain-containing protein [Candidatus Polarisedimenticolia bacterium]